MDIQLCIPRRDLVPQFLRNPLAYIDMFPDVIVALRREAVHMHHRQFSIRVRFEEGFVAVVEAVEGAEKVDGCRRQVHDEVVYGFWDCEDGGGLGSLVVSG